MSAKIKIGFVGVGGMGQCAHLKNYVTVPECEVVALAELRPALRDAVAKKYNVPRTYPTAEAMLAAEKLDGIVASQPFNKHGQIIIPLYKSRIPVFTEKPLAASLDVARKMLAALKKSGTWHMVGYHKRSDPATMYAKAEIDRLKKTGELGKLKYVRLTMPAGDWVASGFIDLIRTDDPIAAMANDPAAKDMNKATWDAYVGFVNYYIHQVNLLRHLLGAPYKVTHADAGGVLLVAESTEGATGLIEMSPFTTTIDWQESALVCFEHGWIRLELPAPLASNRPGRVVIMRDPGKGATPQTIEPTLPWVHAMRQQAINFVRAIKGEIKPLCDANEAIEDLKVARDYMRFRRGA
ncbi:MAG: Gfo/Idh/MocA family oxidoreductase [Lentisphaerae bacterium]|nr:Gfo/Idh/MocA family oxidoreductase [Lentisphaerota bacterium]